MHRSDAVCVVESPKDLIAIEKTGIWKGQYYVLLGTIAPSEGRGPDDLNLHKLMRRIDEGGVKEVVIATDADAEGEMTAMHLVKVLKPKGVKVSRIGLGIPMGSSVEFADLSTLSMSINARREMGEHVGH
jgi:recombination protein RecR